MVAVRQPMVVVAQLVEPRIVIPVVAGSSPVDHPIFPIGSHIGLWAGEEEWVYTKVWGKGRFLVFGSV